MSWRSSWYAFDNKRGDNMLVLMLDSRFKNMRLVTMHIGNKNVIIMIVKYNKYLLLHLPMKGKQVVDVWQ